jgi:hypothetical protein
VNAKAVAEQAAEVKHVSVEEARMKMQGVVRNWLLETIAEKGAVKPN